MIFAQAEEFLFACDPRQAQCLGSLPVPLAQHLLAFCVVVTDAQVFLEIFLGVGQAVLGFGSKHGQRLQVAWEIALAGSGRVAASYAGLCTALDSGRDLAAFAPPHEEGCGSFTHRIVHGPLLLSESRARE